jgi:hypothetical protein
MNKSAVLFLSAVIFFSSCEDEEEQFRDPLTGNWNARWEMINPVMQEIFSQEQRIMNGEVFFDINQARIRAYGFEGCAFKTDTSENILFFRKQNGTLNLISTDDHVIFSYVIADENDNLLKLMLMEDISLTLTR